MFDLYIEQVILVVVALSVARSSAISLQNKQGLPSANQILAWVILGKFMKSYFHES
jgi:hypothetical protein